MLKLEHINKTYNMGTVTETKLFEDFNLTIDKGSFVSVVGSNGSGKTSLLNLICGEISLDSGSITIDNQDIAKLREFKRYRRIGRVYQDPSKGTCPDLTILENLSLADNKGKMFGLQSGVDRKKTEYYKELLSSLGLGLEDKLNIKMRSLSGGQRQAISLIMSTMTPLDFLILDEHTAALDPKTADIIMELTDNLVRQKGLTAIMVTHNLRYAVQYGDRLIMMDRGNIVLDKQGKEKKNTTIEDVLELFNKISIECGN